MIRRINDSEIELKVGDITEEDTDAIVNAANERLIHGGGVAGAIVRKGGQIIQEESNKIGRVKVGNAVVTTAGALKARYVIHAVGPRMGEGDEDNKLKSATLNSLRRAEELQLESLAFPAISTGIFRFPKDRCADIMLKTVKEYLEGDTSIKKVVFCLFSEEDYRIFEKAFKRILGE
jgi:O-acetyl-ADP-ribose deacetylase (regulator of RNase III)